MRVRWKMFEPSCKMINMRWGILLLGLGIGCAVEHQGFGPVDSGRDTTVRDTAVDTATDSGPDLSFDSSDMADTSGDVSEDTRDAMPDVTVDECPDDPAKIVPGVCGCGVPDVDSDGDTYFACGSCTGDALCDDCNDGLASANPGLEESCDGLDNNCDGVVDEGCNGCADGEREGFLDEARWPDIAGCSGAWDVPGVRAEPSCGREGGDEGLRRDGVGCSIADLCPTGWSVCESARVVEDRATNCNGIVMPTEALVFVSAASGVAGMCGATGSNDVFGCGTIGTAVTESSCAPLNRTLFDDCEQGGAPAWGCPGASPTTEADFLVKTSSERGGALCCRD